MNRDVLPPPDQMILQILMGKLISRVLTAVVDVNVADHLVDGPKSTADLAETTDSNEDALYRMLRVLSAYGIFQENEDRVFANNGASALLASETQGSLRDMVRWINCKPAWEAWGRLDFSLKTGKPAFDEVFGKQVFDYFKEDEVTADIFHSAMTAFSSMTAHAVADGYDFSGLQTIVDVGGGHGALLSAIVPTIPGLTGIVYDLPEVVQGADLGELAEKISTRGGSFFDGVPEGADAYIMQHIIHDWSDEHCVTILGHCRESMAEGGKVLVLEQVITNAPESAFGKLMDIEMLAMTDGGRERTEAEFEALFAEAGLKMTKIVPTPSPVCVVEAVKA